MNHIPTTATAVQKLNRLAKTRRKTAGGSLAASQDAVAREHGYHDWKHVKTCLEATVAARAAPPVLPEVVSEFLAEQRILSPASPETFQAIASGVVFAMDIKDAENVNPTSSPDIEECEDATAFLAGDVWQASLRHAQEELGEDAQNSFEPDEQLQQFLDDIGNYRYFRYSGPLTPKTLDDVFAGPLRDFFFPPTHVWIGGKFFDMADVREVRVDGRVVYSTTPARPSTPRANASSAASAAPAGRAGRRSESAPLIARLDVRRLQPSLYEFQVSHSGQELFSDAGFSSIADAFRSAAEVTGAIRGYEVAYAGMVAGTYSVEELASSADAVAQRAVDLAASLGRR